MIFKGSLSCYFTKHIFDGFHHFIHHGQATIFLGEINERYEALCNDNKQVGT